MQGELFPVPPRDAPIGAIEAWVDDLGRWPAMGVDEAGRGPLAGPVVAAAVVLPAGPLPENLRVLNDSKKLTERVREELVMPIEQYAVAYGVAFADAREIDEINILEATRNAMRRSIEKAIGRLGRNPEMLLVDGHLPLPDYEGEQWPLVKGDGRSFNIAAASILAKVARDRFMIEMDVRYPEYGFARHKGYGTRAHREAMERHGRCPLHRSSFKWRPSS